MNVTTTHILNTHTHVPSSPFSRFLLFQGARGVRDVDSRGERGQRDDDAAHFRMQRREVGGAIVFVTFILFSFVLLFRWCECCVFSALAHANLTIKCATFTTLQPTSPRLNLT
jgi:hypothetical protein